ncbi:unnamed protein product [Arabis nemorensis]|uniref:Uncharacterized protein n=1 Tax=Arabis nemorensis TaxID=586526 RepID=A0A565B0N4_9BRAS|nr:unnamed protein product [Arabis nemorensis]
MEKFSCDNDLNETFTSQTFSQASLTEIVDEVIRASEDDGANVILGQISG